jgi:predicted RNA-binding Zn ribbon-like protein
VSASSPIPHGLELVLDFVNTRDVEAETDELASTAGLSGWLVARGLLDTPAPAGEQQLERALRLRDALRAAMLANNGGKQHERDIAELEDVARRGELAVRFATPGAMRLQAGASGVDGALASLLVPVAHAMQDGTWQRVKACPASDCHWAFYDRSRNRSGRWCEMAVCGNRTKVRTYRARSPRRGAG